MTNGLVKVFKEPKKESTVSADFGTVNGDMSITLDNLGIPIKQGEYLVSETVEYERVFDTAVGQDVEGGDDTENHIEKQKLCPGDRVLILWVANIPVVIGLFLDESKKGRRF